jgi:hypothetical protein
VFPKDANSDAHIGDVLTTKNSNNLVHASSRLVKQADIDN